jgi:hypothetical protein
MIWPDALDIEAGSDERMPQADRLRGDALTYSMHSYGMLSQTTGSGSTKNHHTGI